MVISLILPNLDRSQGSHPVYCASVALYPNLTIDMLFSYDVTSELDSNEGYHVLIGILSYIQKLDIMASN